MRAYLLFPMAFCVGHVLAASPAILNSGDHANEKIVPAIVAVLGSQPLNVDYLPGNVVTRDPTLAANTKGAYFAVGTTSPVVNHAVYAVFNASVCCYMLSQEVSFYATLVGQGTLYTSPLAVQVGGANPAGIMPPAALLSSSSVNSGNGGTGWGIELGLSASYKGLDTSEDSWVSAEMAGMVAALLYKHRSWNFFDAKAALRQTASNWATGYDHTNFGYGLVDWDGANAASTLYLQTPDMTVTNKGYFATITLYPFRQARRSAEVIYAVNSDYVWPVANEYTTSDISASGGTLIYTSNGADVVPSFDYAPATSGRITFVAFTTDGQGHYSRVEEFSRQSTVLMVGTVCVP